MKSKPTEPHTGSIVAQDKKGRGSQSATLQASEKRKRANKEFTVATYNVRTLNNTITSQVKVSHKIEQFIAGCEVNNISIVKIQEHRLKSSSDINLKNHGVWTLAHRIRLMTAMAWPFSIIDKLRRWLLLLLGSQIAYWLYI